MTCMLKRSTPGMLAIAGLLVSGTLCAGTATDNPPPSDPRDFSGVWWTRGYDRTFRPVTDPPQPPAKAAKLLPFTATEAASWQHHLDMEKAGTPIADAPTQCYPHGVPR